MISAIHDEATGDLLLALAAVLGLLLMAVAAWRRPGARSIVRGAIAGLVVTCLSGLIRSSATSGDLLRTRFGFPHYFLMTNLDPDTGHEGSRFFLAYFLVNAAVWVAIAVIGASVIGRKRPD